MLATLLVPILILGLTWLYRNIIPTYKWSSKSPSLTKISNLPILGAIGFFNARWDFFRHARDQAATGNFSFWLGKHPVVGLSGAEGRKVFFENRDLGFAEGYAVLFGGSPKPVKESSVAGAIKASSEPGNYFSRRLIKMLSTENFAKDVRSSLDTLAQDPAGITDPFESIYRVVYQLTMRMVGCDDIAEDPVLLEKTLQLYESVESSATAAAILFPWFPSWGILKRTIAGGRLYVIIKKIVDERKKSSKRREDPLQFLMDQGDSITKIIEFVIGALFAGLLNSGVNAGWVLTYLCSSPAWHQKILNEIRAAAHKHSPYSTLPLVDQLAMLPLSAWETEFPLLDLCLRDSIRLQLPGTMFRKNVSGGNIPIGADGEVVPPGAFVTYALNDVHMDPKSFKDPEEWDPSRYERGEGKGSHGFLGWGSGRHPCLGMRFAKLEQNIITAFFLAMFEYDLVLKDGTATTELPKPDVEAHSAVKPARKVYFKYKLREDVRVEKSE